MPYLTIDPSVDGERVGHIGSSPRIPEGFDLAAAIAGPVECQFIFQLRLPDASALAGHTLLLFVALYDVERPNVIPWGSVRTEWPDRVTDGFIDKHQTFFKALLLSEPCTVAVPEMASPAAERAIILTASEPSAVFGRLDAEPLWLMEPEVPPPFENGTAPRFVLQLSENVSLPLAPGAARQMRIDHSTGGLKPRVADKIDLFVANEAYVFAYPSGETWRPMIVVQNSG